MVQRSLRSISVNIAVTRLKSAGKERETGTQREGAIAGKGLLLMYVSLQPRCHADHGRIHAAEPCHAGTVRLTCGPCARGPQGPRPASTAPPDPTPPRQVPAHAIQPDAWSTPAAGPTCFSSQRRAREGPPLARPRHVGARHPPWPGPGSPGPCGPVGTAEWVGSAGPGCAGAATAGACGLCLAGSYQTGSGSA